MHSISLNGILTCRWFILALRSGEAFNMNTVVCQQVGAPPHCSNCTLEYLRQYFSEDRLISRRTRNSWSPPPTPLIWARWTTFFPGAIRRRKCMRTTQPQLIKWKKTSKKKWGKFWKTFWRESSTISMSSWWMSSSGKASELIINPRKFFWLIRRRYIPPLMKKKILEKVLHLKKLE